MNNAKIFFLIIGLLILGVLTTVVIRGGGATTSAEPGKYDAFASCLSEKGAVFYGAFWCPHCQDQKKLFGTSAKLLPYVECSTPNGQGQLQVCIDKEIKGYPTWDFADGERMNAVLQLEQLAEKTSCPLRQSSSEASELPQ